MNTDTSVITLGDGITTVSAITLTRDSVPTNYLNCKVNVASSEMANNAENARDYSLFNPFIRFARWKDGKVKDCMEFFNAVIFVRERDEDISTHREFQDTNYHFYALCNVGDSKKSDASRMNDANDPKEHTVEIKDYNVPLAEFPTGTDGICPESEWKEGNTAYDLLYADYEYEDGKFKSFGSKSYEFRYEKDGITDEERQANIDTWREMYKFIVTSSDEDFYVKLKEWFVVDSALYYYLFTENRVMVDNRAKNLFVHYGKVYISETEAETLGEDAGGYVIDNEQAAIRDGYRYDFSQGYDFDTSYGIGNTGKLNIPYGTEDVDFYVEGDSTSGYIFRAAESTFFCRLRDLFNSEMQAVYVDRENVNTWSASRTIKQWDDSQRQFPEELLRLHYQRLYIRTYQGTSIDNSIPKANPRFLEEMMNGLKKYQRRMFMRNNELYFATKYFGKTATQDQIMMRFNNPVGAAIAPDFTLYITPYSNMYIGTSFGNVTPTNFRAKAGVEYTIPCSIESGTADITLIYGASFIQAIGNLSRCYVGDNDFSKASRLQSLVIGSDVEGYSNSFMTKISLGNNKLLEHLNIQNVTGLNSVVDLSQCNNLLELYAEGSGATGVIFANGGKLEEAYIPAVTSLTMKNLNYIETFEIEGYDKLSTLVVENTPFIDTFYMVTNSPELKVLRLIGLDWNIADNSILERVYLLRGINNTGGEIDKSVLAGYVYIPTINQYDLLKYQEQWSDLEIEGIVRKQVPVYFKNYDGTILDTQYVLEGEKPVDPIISSRIDTPIKPSDPQYDYTYIGWDASFANVAVGGTYVYTAQYKSVIRKYTVKFVQPPEFNITTPLQETVDIEYGSFVSYEGETPTYTTPEDQGAFTFYLFDKWNDIGYVDGDKTITAIYDSCTYTDGYFNNLEIKDMRPVELYMLTKLIMRGQISLSMNSDGSDYIGVESTEINPYDEFSFTTGVDVDYGSVESVDLFPDGARTFSGTVGDYYDTGIKLLEIDRSFVLAVDYEFGSDNRTGASLMQCYQTGTSDGFKLHYSSNPVITWSNSTATQCASGTNREMLIIRHKAGETGAYVYTSNLQGTETGYIDFSSAGLRIPIIELNLIFGSNYEAGEGYKNYAKGTIHWAKLWYNDLGESVCKDLASYIHEPVKTQLCGFRRHYLAGSNSSKSIFSFLGLNALYSNRIMNTGTNTGGWAEASLNEWLNTRFYKGLPLYMKQLLKKVTIASTIGGQSTELSTSDCYIYIPAIADIKSGVPDYENEISPGSLISYMTSNDDRIRYDSSGVNAVNYWTRSPNLESSYYHYVKTTGETSGYGSASSSYGVVIMFSI